MEYTGANRIQLARAVLPASEENISAVIPVRFHARLPSGASSRPVRLAVALLLRLFLSLLPSPALTGLRAQSESH